MAVMHFLFDTAGRFLVGIFLLRFFMQMVRANFRNPIAQVVVKFTNPIVMPLRRVIPGWGGIDNASLVAALIVQAIIIVLMLLLFGGGSMATLSITGILFSTFFSLLLAAIGLYTMLVFLSVLLSWINRDPSNPLAALLHTLTEPLLRPARRMIPPIGGFDISPLVVLLALQALSILVSQDLLPRLA
ncbi:MAG: YggT family protein [Gammaproteobacteria bacterium]